MKTTINKIITETWPHFDPDQVSRIKNLILFNNKSISDVDEVVDIKTGDKISLPGDTYIYIYSFNESVGAKKDVFVSGNSGKKVTMDIPKDLTLENYQEKMGQRFKMTKSEVQRFKALPKAEARQKAFEARYALHRD